MEFYLGQVFEGGYTPEAAEWCNEQGNCFIKEIDTGDYMRRFEIKEISQDVLKQNEIAEIKSQLNEIDLKSIRAIRAGDSEYIENYEIQALELRERLAALEE